MNTTNPLDSIYFMRVPEDFTFSAHAFKIDRSIPLPIQKRTDGAVADAEISAEQILSGILLVLAYDRHNNHLDYYRSIIKAVRPDIQKELTEAAILKAKNEDWELAEEIFRALIGLEPQNPATALNMALFLDQRAESYRRSGLHGDADAYDNDALHFYKEAMAAEPAVPDAFFNCAFFYLKQYNFTEAKSCFETYIALTCGMSDEELGDSGLYKQARAQEMVDRINNENMEDAAFMTAYQFIASGQEEKGLEAIRAFITKNPKIWNAWFLLGWGLRRLERWEDATKAFEKALSLGGGENADTRNELAICLIETGKLKEAKKELLSALSLAPEDTKIISNLGYCFLREGNRAEAQKYFAAVLEYSPNDKIAVAELQKLESAASEIAE